jgi:two-component system nitrogen regulation response regulator GlnG
MSAQNTFMTAIKASEKGAYEYLPKPFDLTELIGIIGRALSEPKRKPVKIEDDMQDGMPLVGRSAAMQDDLPRSGAPDADRPDADDHRRIRHRQGTRRPRAARLRQAPQRSVRRHQHGRHPARPDRVGTVRPREGRLHRCPDRSTGRFEQAEGGTLFLDEIGDMPMDAQTRLLRVLQQGEYTTVGGRTPIRTDVRIVAATNKDLKQAINQGLFREDLYYRLNVVPMRLPPLRDRAEDIPDLVRHFIQQAEKEGLGTKRFDQEALDLMKAYAWPGNVRELENLIRRLMALYPQDVITREIIESELRSDVPDSPIEKGPMRSGNMTIAQAVEENMRSYFATFGDNLPPPGLYDRVLTEMEYPLILAALTATRGNQIKAADLLGLNRNTLRKKIRELGVSVYRSSRTA